MKMIINGEYRDSKSGKTLDVCDSSNGKVIDTVPDAARKDVDEAIGVAQNGKRIWAGTPLYERCEILKCFAGKMLENAARIAELECRETGRPLQRCMGDVPAAANTFKTVCRGGPAPLRRSDAAQ